MTDSISLLDVAYPARHLWHDWEVPFVGNASIKWKGQAAFLIDANGKVYQSDALVLDTAWYHCVTCDQRLSLGSKFCPECGTQLDWEHTGERDKDAEREAQQAADAKIATVVAELGAADA